MSSCCGATGECSLTPDAAGEFCPACGTKGARVEPITLKALLTAEGLRRGVPPAPRYCANATCPVVYFDKAVPVAFDERDLTVPVQAKHPESDEIPLCYCFGHTQQTIRQEIVRSGRSTATATITEDVKAGHCACEVRNPKGACCLGEISKAERRLLANLTLTTT